MPGVDIKKDDNVRVMAGKDRGHTGRVIHVLPGKGKVMVEGAARAKKHQRATGKRSTSGAQLQQGGIIDTELYIDISNVQLVCRSCGQPTRVGHRTDVDGKKARICRKCEAEL
ncbi:MAG: 50S ribosomal protein L24 [Actinobacteria bacterium RBG_19FT_COMBO_70_19]|jgi:large subunit ribosomal protein L24|nr:MAG: 50S ribosomal protein L24 [Actinobacteria bacterium RBG_19FT_COMBO_70_19]